MDRADRAQALSQHEYTHTHTHAYGGHQKRAAKKVEQKLEEILRCRRRCSLNFFLQLLLLTGKRGGRERGTECWSGSGEGGGRVGVATTTGIYNLLSLCGQTTRRMRNVHFDEAPQLKTLSIFAIWAKTITTAN